MKSITMSMVFIHWQIYSFLFIHYPLFSLAYVQQMEDVLAEAGEGFLRLKSKVSAFRAELQAEEEMSRNINDPALRNGRLQ